MREEQTFGYIAITIAFILLVAVGCMIDFLYQGYTEEKRLMKQCMSAGHAEYECVGILRERR